MHRNLWWMIFLTVLSLIVAWFVGHALYQVYIYSRFSSQTTGTVKEWSVVQVGTSDYRIHGKYLFEVHNKRYEGEATLNDRAFRNSFAAEKAIEEMPLNQWTVWYNSDDPSRSQLDRIFPTKDCVYASILIGLLVYFLSLGFYMERIKAKDTQCSVSINKP